MVCGVSAAAAGATVVVGALVVVAGRDVVVVDAVVVVVGAEVVVDGRVVVVDELVELVELVVDDVVVVDGVPLSSLRVTKNKAIRATITNTTNTITAMPSGDFHIDFGGSEPSGGSAGVAAAGPAAAAP